MRQNGTTGFTAITSVYAPTLGPDATPTGTAVNFPEDGTSTTLPIDTSTACYCSIPATTYTTQIQTVTIHGPTPSVLTVTIDPAPVDLHATKTICPCASDPTNYATDPTTNVGVTPTTQSVVPTTQSVAGASVQETTGVDDNLFVNANGGVPGIISVQLVGIATFFGLIGAGVVFL